MNSILKKGKKGRGEGLDLFLIYHFTEKDVLKGLQKKYIKKNKKNKKKIQ